MTPTNRVLCPECGSGELRPGRFLASCSGCDYAMRRDLFRTLLQIRELPEAGHLTRRFEARHLQEDEGSG